MRSTLRAFAGLVLVLLTSACLVETEATLSDPDAKAADPRLAGTWYFNKAGETVLFSVIVDPDRAGTYRVVFTNIKPQAPNPVESIHYSAWRTVLNGQSYLNVRRTGGNLADMPALTVVSYDIGGGGTLVLRLMAPEPVIAAIESGKLKGRFKKGRYTSDATITSPRADLAAFIASANRDTLFATKTGGLRKLAEDAN